MEESEEYKLGSAYIKRGRAIKDRERISDTLHPIRDKLNKLIHHPPNEHTTPLGFVNALGLTIEDCDCIKIHVANEDLIKSLTVVINELEMKAQS